MASERERYLQKHYPEGTDLDDRPPPPRTIAEVDERAFMPVAMTLCFVVWPLAVILMVVTLK